MISAFNLDNIGAFITQEFNEVSVVDSDLIN